MHQLRWRRCDSAWGRTLCLNMMSFAMQAGGPVSRTGFPGKARYDRVNASSGQRGCRTALRIETNASPASCASRSSSHAMVAHTEGKKRQQRTRAATRETANMASIMLLGHGGAGDARRGRQNGRANGRAASRGLGSYLVTPIDAA